MTPPRRWLPILARLSLVALLGLGGCESDAPSGPGGSKITQGLDVAADHAQAQAAVEHAAPGWRSLDDLAHGRIGVIMGTVMSLHVEQALPEAKHTILNGSADLIAAIKSDKVDAGIFDAISAQAIIQAHPELAVLDDDLFAYDLGIGFSRARPELRARFNAFLERIRADGRYAEIHHRWFDGDPEQVQMPDLKASDPKERYILGLSIADLPYVAYKDGRYVGFDVEILQAFAAEEDIELLIQALDFGALIPALAAGKVDIITDGMAITPERAKAVDFSAPYGQGHAAAVVLGSKRAEQAEPALDLSASVPNAQGHTGDGHVADTKNRATQGSSATGRQGLDELAEGRIAVFNGTAHDLFVTKTFPKAQVMRFNSQADFVLAVKLGKADAAITDDILIREIVKSNPDLTVLADDFFDTDIAAAFRKGDTERRERFDRFVTDARAEGLLDAIQARWLTDPERAIMPDIPLPERGETIRVGTSYLIGLPYVSEADSRPIGHDVELLQRFAAREGLVLDIIPMEFDALIASLAVGKIDMIMARLSITDERKAKVDFSIPYDRERSAALVQRSALGSDLSADSAGADGSSASGSAAPATGSRSAAGDERASGGPSGPAWRSLDDLAERRIAVFAGSIQDQYVARRYPSAQILHLMGMADLVAALKAGKVDAGIIIAANAPEILATNPEIGVLGESILPVAQAVAFAKGNPDLRERFDRFMAGILADGTHRAMRKRWLEADPSQTDTAVEMPDLPLPRTGPVLRLGTSVLVGLPYVGLLDGEYVGFDIELARRFAAHEGMRLEISPMEFSALIPALSSGKLDLVASALAVTDERKKQVDFSTPYAEVSSVVLALKSNLAVTGPAGVAGPSADTTDLAASGLSRFMGEVADSIHANFILEQRWKLILNGIWVTIVISVASTLFGTVLGAFICWLRMSPQAMLRLFGSSYIFLIRGLPVLLLLMLIFYVAFASVNIDPLIVAVIAFGMNFAAYVSEMFRTGIEGIDRGQSEAGIAMGFTRIQTFVYIILPQAARRILPVYRGEFISMVKMTSIVGYIGVQDLTKAGDIIRSRTFEAFVPLIIVAAIYFLIIWLLGLVLDHIDRRTDPKRRTRAGSQPTRTL